MSSVFLLPNTQIALGLLLVPIDLISYIFKLTSLGVRLFANLMAGHTLLKVIVGFAWSMLLLEDFLLVLHVVPLLVLVLLIRLELPGTIKPLSVCNSTLSSNGVINDFSVLNVKRPRSDSNVSEPSSTVVPMDICESASTGAPSDASESGNDDSYQGFLDRMNNRESDETVDLLTTPQRI